MQIPILNGVYTNSNSDFRTSYPRNLIPVPKQTGVSQEYLAQADGIELFSTGTGVDRGGINWGGTCYRVSGGDFVSFDANGVMTIIGQVDNDGLPVSMDYSFDRLAIVSAGKLYYYYNNSSPQQVTDPDLGNNLRSVIFVDGYFMLVDATNIIITELANPFQIDSLKYGSAEVDPDSIMGLVKVLNEPNVVGRYTIEPFFNTGGDLFPFQRVSGGLINKGTVGLRAYTHYNDAIAFVGSGRNEPLSVWLGVNGRVVKLSTREIDLVLKEYTEDQLRAVVVETRYDKGHKFLLVHLINKTLVYDAAASEVTQQPIWFTLDSGLGDFATYRARHLVWCYNKWVFGDPTNNNLGTYTDKVSSHYNNVVSWEFSTQIVYNENKNVIFHELELVALTGNVTNNTEPVVWTSYSHDGVTWGQESSRKIGKFGDRNKKINWLQQGILNKWRIQRFRGDSRAFLSIARLEVRLEALSV
jgi:hypothetical protein